MDLLESDAKIDINNWYYYTKFRISLKMLTAKGVWTSSSANNNILADIGAGSGVLTRAFFKAFNAPGKKAYAIDKNYKKEDLGIHNGILFCKELPEGVKPSYFFLMDVLEHVENDIDFLSKWVETAPPGTIFLFTVPASKRLWSEHDLYLKHKKRYSLKELEKVISASGLVVLKAHYFYATIYPFVFLKRKIIEPLLKKFGIFFSQGIKPFNSLSNFFLKTILKIEAMICHFNRLFGLTCLVIARKEENI